MLIRLLVVVDTTALRNRLVSVLEPIDASISAAPSRGNFWDHVAGESADLLIVTRKALPDPMIESVESIRHLPHQPDVVVLWDEEDHEERAKLLVAGCVAALDVALSDELLRETIESLVERRRETSQAQLQQEMAEPRYRLSDFESSNPRMTSFLRMVRRVVEPDSSLLILGETGVGKERLARAIHAESPRHSEPFLPINCAAFPETLLEGELFGYEEGAFTGATGNRRGYFEMAHGGTIFLDEIGELPRHLQVKLLRVLQERTIQPLGSEKTIDIDVRVMAATNRDLEEEIKARRFRRDLYYRLSVVTLEIPPLREHPEDIPPLLLRVLEEYRSRLGRSVTEISEEAMNLLCQYSWPGNIRELSNVIERAIILCDGNTITSQELPTGIKGMDAPGSSAGLELVTGNAGAPELFDLPWNQVKSRILGQYAQAYLTHQLQVCRGRVGEVAQRTGVPPRTLYALMRRYGLDKKHYRNPSSP